MGKNFVDFLRQLNNLHLHLSMGQPAFVPPDLRVEKVGIRLQTSSRSPFRLLCIVDDACVWCAFILQVTSSSVELHYRSQRPGLGSWVVGICEKVAADFYDLRVDFKHLRGREDGSCDHEVGQSDCQGQTD